VIQPWGMDDSRGTKASPRTSTDPVGRKGRTPVSGRPKKAGMRGSGVITARRNAHRDLQTAVRALSHGIPLERTMTDMERLCLGVAATEPTHHLTLGTSDMTQRDLARAFRLLRPLIETRRNTTKPLIYFGAFAKGAGEGGVHLHLLLWEMPMIVTWREQCKSLGIGNPHVKRLSQPGSALAVAGYVAGQQQAVFGSRKHEENKARTTGTRRWVMPQDRTLEAHHPGLCHAMRLAKDKSIPDEVFFASLPGFFEPLRPELKQRVTTMANQARGSRRPRRNRLLAAYSGRETGITMPKGRKRGKR
jgi:hypothetical protein